MKPQIHADAGANFQNMEATIKRLSETSNWKKLDTIMLIPAGGTIPTRTALAMWNLYAPPNNGFFRMACEGMEVGEAFSTAIQNILDTPQLANYKYILTIEHDNLPQPDGLVKLLAQMEAHHEFACISGLVEPQMANTMKITTTPPSPSGLGQLDRDKDKIGNAHAIVIALGTNGVTNSESSTKSAVESAMKKV